MLDDMNELLLSVIKDGATALFGGIFGYLIQKKQTQIEAVRASADSKKILADSSSSEVDNAEKVLKYYREMIDDLGSRLTLAIKELSDTRMELSDARKELSESRNIIHELKTTVENLTVELGRYKQLNGKK
jgi:chromosome segregation ATPase